VPGAPGRVVTLVREAGATCWGMAYEVAPDAVGPVLAGLDQREKGGYERVEAELRFGDSTLPVRAEGLLYLATPDNPNYLGPAPLEAIAAQVVASSGPSGANVEYVLRLAEALTALRPDLSVGNEEALALAERVRALAEARTGDPA